MKTIYLALLLSLTSAFLSAKPLDSSYVLPKSLGDWNSQTQSYEKQGRRVTTYAIYSPNRTHVITIAFVTGYKDKEITKDHFDALVNSFSREGLIEVKEKTKILKYGMEGAQVIAHGVVQQKEFKAKGMILKSGESELTIMLFAIGIELDDEGFSTALSGLGIAQNENH